MRQRARQRYEATSHIVKDELDALTTLGVIPVAGLEPGAPSSGTGPALPAV